MTAEMIDQGNKGDHDTMIGNTVNQNERMTKVDLEINLKKDMEIETETQGKGRHKSDKKK